MQVLVHMNGASVAIRDQPDIPDVGPTALRMMLGAQLRRLRSDRRISQQRAADAIRGSASKISRLELGQLPFRQRDVADLLTLYGIDDPTEREVFLRLAQQANEPGWWQRFSDVLPDWFESYVGLEEAAVQLRIYELLVVPGLFQTEDYARAVITAGPASGSPEEVEQRVKLRLTRQQILTRGNAPTIWAIIDESALHREFGGPTLLRAQLQHLIDLAERPNITLQVMPTGASTPFADGGPFVILRFAGEDLPNVVYVEELTTALYLDKATDVDRYDQVMTFLAAASRPPKATIDILHRLLSSKR